MNSAAVIMMIQRAAPQQLLHVTYEKARVYIIPATSITKSREKRATSITKSQEKSAVSRREQYQFWNCYPQHIYLRIFKNGFENNQDDEQNIRDNWW